MSLLCNLCSLEFKLNNVDQMMEHFHNVHNAYLPCGRCFNQFVTNAARSKHSHKVVPVKPGHKRHPVILCQCKFCFMLFSSVSNWKDHMDHHHETEQSKFKCRVCPCQLFSVFSLELHLKDVHQLKQIGSSTDLVAIKRSSASMTAVHSTTYETLQGLLAMTECHVCRKICVSLVELTLHYMIFHHELKHPSRITSFHITLEEHMAHILDYCSLCCRFYNFAKDNVGSSFKKHCTRHHNSKRPALQLSTNCLFCQKPQNSADKFFEHIKTHTNFYKLTLSTQYKGQNMARPYIHTIAKFLEKHIQKRPHGFNQLQLEQVFSLLLPNRCHVLVCRKQFNDRRHLLHHYIFEHLFNDFCSLCCRYFDFASDGSLGRSLKHHQDLLHSDNTPLVPGKCLFCNEFAPNGCGVGHLKQHMLEKHKDQLDRLTCWHCSQTFLCKSFKFRHRDQLIHVPTTSNEPDVGSLLPNYDSAHTFATSLTNDGRGGAEGQLDADEAHCDLTAQLPLDTAIPASGLDSDYNCGDSEDRLPITAASRDLIEIPIGEPDIKPDLVEIMSSDGDDKKSSKKRKVKSKKSEHRSKKSKPITVVTRSPSRDDSEGTMCCRTTQWLSNSINASLPDHDEPVPRHHGPTTSSTNDVSLQTSPSRKSRSRVREFEPEQPLRPMTRVDPSRDDPDVERLDDLNHNKQYSCTLCGVVIGVYRKNAKQHILDVHRVGEPIWQTFLKIDEISANDDRRIVQTKSVPVQTDESDYVTLLQENRLLRRKLAQVKLTMREAFMV